MPLEIDIPQMSLALQLVLIRPRISQTVMNKHFEYLHFLQRRKKIDFSKHPMWPSPYSADNSQQVSLSLSLSLSVEGMDTETCFLRPRIYGALVR